MKLPIIVNGKTFYMDFKEWKREKEWRRSAEKAFPPKTWKELLGKYSLKKT